MASSESEGTTNKAMAIKSGNNYKGLLYGFTSSGSTVISGCTTTTSGAREPDIVSDYDNNTSYNNGLFTKASLQQDYNKMIESVNKYRGFYISRYELGLEGAVLVSKNASTNTGVVTANANNYSTKMWYGLYSKRKEYAPEESDKAVVSSMMWGSQYDAMLNWMIKQGVDVTVTGARNTTQVTGSNANDVINNVFDLYGCNSEWTLEAVGTGRGRFSGVHHISEALSTKYSINPDNTSNGISTHFTLYIK